MNLNKARDFYSAYYEKSLDEGLRQAFERAMELDSQVSAEYQQFVRIMDQLKALEAPVQVPSDLHLKIRERVDAHIIAQEHKAKAQSWFFGWKPIAYGAVAAVAIIAGLVSISNQGGGRFAAAGIGGTVKDSSPKLAMEDGTLTLRFASSKANNVSIKEATSGRALFGGQVTGQELVAPIKNSSEAAVVVSVQFGTGYDPYLIAVPGSRVASEGNGVGTPVQMIAVLAQRFSTPVVVQGNVATSTVAWDFEGTDPLAAVKDELDLLGLKAEIREGGLLWISSN
jgi:hypothetical protein